MSNCELSFDQGDVMEMDDHMPIYWEAMMKHIHEEPRRTIGSDNREEFFWKCCGMKITYSTDGLCVLDSPKSGFYLFFHRDEMGPIRAAT